MLFSRWDECVQGVNLDFVYISVWFQDLLHPENKQNIHQSKKYFLSKSDVLEKFDCPYCGKKEIDRDAC
jgi:hypothetical protein